MKFETGGALRIQGAFIEEGARGDRRRRLGDVTRHGID